MTSMAGDGAGWEAVNGAAKKAWPHVSPRQQAAVEAKYFEEGATVDFERLPGPPAVARLFRSGTGPQRTLVIMARVTSVARSAGRPLNQAEIDTLAEQGARAAGRLAWVLPVATVGAGVLTWIDRKRFRFPFYTPPKSGWFDPRAFPTRRTALVRGRNAGAVWHGVRFAAYLPLTWFGTGLFFASMMRTRFLADMADPRLEGVRADIQQHQVAQGQKATGMPHPASPDNAEAWQEQDKVTESFSSLTRSSAAPARSEAPPSSSAAGQPPGGEAVPSAPWPSQRNSAPEPQTPFDDTDLFEDDDDASPVPVSVRRAERRQAAQQAQQQQQQELQRQARQPQTAGSSWSRVRQQAGVGGSPPATADTGDDAPPRSRTASAWTRVRRGGGAATTSDMPSGGEGYPYGESDDDSATSKSQAQKQFDDMLEAERRGGSDSGRGGKRGW